MINFSDGQNDGLVLFYVKNGNVYPVAVNKEEMETLDIMIGKIITRLAPMTGIPIGTIELLNFSKNGKSL